MNEILDQFMSAVSLNAPRVLAAAVLLILALVLAAVVRKILTGVLTGLNVDGRLMKYAGAEVFEGQSISRTLAETIYWLIILLFLPAILGALEMRGLLAPMENMVQALVGFLPNLLAAAIIFGLVGSWSALSSASFPDFWLPPGPILFRPRPEWLRPSGCPV